MADPPMQDTQKEMNAAGEVERLVIPRKRPRSGTTDTSTSPGTNTTNTLYSDGLGEDNIVLPVPGEATPSQNGATAAAAGRSVSLGPTPSPTKSRSPSCSLNRDHITARRTPSLNDSPIPILRPEDSSNNALGRSGSISATPIGKSVRLGTCSSSRTGLEMRRASGGFISPLAARSISSPSKLDGIKNAEYAQLLRQDKELTMEISRLQKQIDISTQALKIEHKDEDGQLEELTEKWREAAKEIANNLFGQAAERMNRYGGYAEYKTRQNERKKALQEWESSSEYPEGFESMSEEAKEEYQQALEESRQQQAQTKEQEDDDDETEFTMEIMLKTLNVDPNILFPKN